MTNKLNKKFEDFGSIPNPDVWAGIEAALNRKRRKKRLLWIFLPTTAAVILVALFLTFLPSTPEKTKTIQAKETRKVGRSLSKPGIEKRKDEKYSVPTGNNPEIEPHNISFGTSKNPIQKREIEERKVVIHSASTGNDPEIEPFTTNSVSETNPETEKLSSEADLSASTSDTIKEFKPQNDSTLAENGIKAEPEPKKDTVRQKSRWSFSLQAGTWDASHNRDELISEPTIQESLDATSGTSSFVPPQTVNMLDTDTVSVLKPLSLRANIAFTGKKGWTYTTGLNFDRMQTFYNQKETRFTSLGMNIGFGKEIIVSERFSLIPLFLVNYDRFVYEKVHNPAVPAYVTNPVGQQFSFQLDMQLAFRLTEKHSLVFTPATKYYAYQSLSTGNGPILRRDWWNGLHLGWKYSF